MIVRIILILFLLVLSAGFMYFAINVIFLGMKEFFKIYGNKLNNKVDNNNLENKTENNITNKNKEQ